MPYQAALFVHFLGLFALVSGFALLQHGGWKLRHAAGPEQIGLWLDFVQRGLPALRAGLGLLLASGLAMAWMRGEPAAAWALVAVAAAGAIGMTSGGLQQRLGAIQAALAGGAPDPLAGTPTPWVALAAANGLAVGLLWLMVAKPDLTGSLAVALASLALGAAVGRRLAA